MRMERRWEELRAFQRPPIRMGDHASPLLDRRKASASQNEKVCEVFHRFRANRQSQVSLGAQS
jgi:hypothetical protein